MSDLLEKQIEKLERSYSLKKVKDPLGFSYEENYNSNGKVLNRQVLTYLKPEKHEKPSAVFLPINPQKDIFEPFIKLEYFLTDEGYISSIETSVSRGAFKV